MSFEAAVKELFASGQLWRGEGKESSSAAAVSLPFIDYPLTFGAVHEWSLADRALKQWAPPLTFFAELLRNIPEEKKTERNMTVWIGRRCWPTPHLLHRISGEAWSEEHLFLDPPGKEKRLWAIEHVLHSPIVAAVVADAQGMNTLATRRMQLAARQGGTLALLARPAEELSLLSAAATKWRVTPRAEGGRSWEVTLVKGRSGVCPFSWQLEWCEEWGSEGFAPLSKETDLSAEIGEERTKAVR